MAVAGCAHLIGNCGASARINQQRSCGDPFGVDNLVVVKQQLEIINKAAVALVNGTAIDQMADLDQHL